MPGYSSPSNGCQLTWLKWISSSASLWSTLFWFCRDTDFSQPCFSYVMCQHFIMLWNTCVVVLTFNSICAPGACGHEGVCIDLPDNRGYTCSCPVGKSGDRCDRGKCMKTRISFQFNILTAYHKTAVTPFLMHWSYHSLWIIFCHIILVIFIRLYLLG